MIAGLTADEQACRDGGATAAEVLNTYPPGDLVRMPRGIPHAYHNNGDAPGRALFWVSPAGKLILTSHASRTPRLWNAATGELVADLAPHSQPVYGARFSPDGLRLITTSADALFTHAPEAEAQVWETATGRPLTAPCPVPTLPTIVPRALIAFAYASPPVRIFSLFVTSE